MFITFEQTKDTHAASYRIHLLTILGLIRATCHGLGSYRYGFGGQTRANQAKPLPAQILPRSHLVNHQSVYTLDVLLGIIRNYPRLDFQLYVPGTITRIRTRPYYGMIGLHWDECWQFLEHRRGSSWGTVLSRSLH